MPTWRTPSRMQPPGWRAALLVALALGEAPLVPGLAAAAIHEAELVEARFGSVAEALDDAVRRFLPLSVAEDREHLGAIFSSRGPLPEFVYSVATGARGRDELSARLRTPAGFRLAAIWHTHGAAGPGRGWFSARDTGLAATLEVPIYLATPDGELRVFHPGSATLSALQARRLSLGVRAGVARGEPARPGAAQLAKRRCTAEHDRAS